MFYDYYETPKLFGCKKSVFYELQKVKLMKNVCKCKTDI